MFLKKSVINYDTDKEQLINLMEAFMNGEAILCNENDFNDKLLAQTYNKLISKIAESDKSTAISLNQSMDIIGNCNHMRSLLDIVDGQIDKLESVAQTGNSLSDSIKESEEILNSINDNVSNVYNTSVNSSEAVEKTISSVRESYDKLMAADSAMKTFSENSQAIKDISEVIAGIAKRTQILSLNARIEAGRSGDGKGFAVVANEIGKLSSDTQESVKQMEGIIQDILTNSEALISHFNDVKNILEYSSTSVSETYDSVQETTSAMNNVMQEINTLFEQIQQQNTATTTFANQTIAISNDSDTLAEYCKKPGMDMYRISRSVDKIRTTFVKNRTKLSDKELIDVYITDHLIFTGRLYNMIVGFEELNINNLNQPDNCKYGKWAVSLKKNSPQLADKLRTANSLHVKLHELATACYQANQASDKSKALEFFDEAQKVYKDFAAELTRLKDFF